MGRDPTASTGSFGEATEVTLVAPNAYRVYFNQNWTIGAVPHGGYAAGTVLQAGAAHLRSRGQKDTVTAHFEFVSRTEVGPAIIVIEDTKPGRSFTTLHATVYQGDLLDEAPFYTAKSRKPIFAYLINGDMASEDGLTLDAGWELLPPPKPVDWTKLTSEEDPNWTAQDSRIDMAQRKVAKAPGNLEIFFPRESGRLGLEDNWIRLRSGESWTIPALAFLADAMPIVVEAWRPKADGDDAAPFKRSEHFWYPTLVMNLDVKKALPPGGVEWLFLRTEARQIRNGRFDLQATILDKDGDLVALASHTNLILPIARNLAKRGSGGKL